MKTKVIDIKTVDNTTYITIATNIGTFTGKAVFNPDKDPLSPSEMTGGQIAEFRAYIKYYNELIKRKQAEIKGVKRLQSAAKPKTDTWYRAEHLLNTMANELEYLTSQKINYKNSIKNVIKSRGIYVRSRQTDHEARARGIKTIQDAIKFLGQNS